MNVLWLANVLSCAAWGGGGGVCGVSVPISCWYVVLVWPVAVEGASPSSDQTAAAGSQSSFGFIGTCAVSTLGAQC